MQTCDVEMTEALSAAFFGEPSDPPVSHARTRRRKRYRKRPVMSSTFLDASGVAEFLGVSRRWVMERTRKGELPALRFGKTFRYKMSGIEGWVEAQNAKR